MASSTVKGRLYKSALFLKDCVTVEAETDHSATILFFHGLGDTGHGWSDILTEYRPTNCQVICPTAPRMAVSINNGYVMPSWYDIFTLSSDEKQDVNGIKETSRKVHEALDEIEQNGIPSNRIILGGISQGGALAIYSALTYHKQLAGLVCLSCWLPIREELVKNCSSVNKTIPMLQCHGDADPTVRIEFGGKQTDEFLSNINPSNHQYKVYNGLRHWISPEEMDDVKKWMSNCVS